MAHSSKKAITGRLWFCTMPRRDQPSLLFMFLSSSHHILEAREEKSGSQKRPWPMPWNPRAVSASDFVPDVRLKGPIAFDTWQSFLFVFSLSESPSRPLCRLSVTLVLYGYMAPWNSVWLEEIWACFSKKWRKAWSCCWPWQRIKAQIQTKDWIFQPFPNEITFFIPQHLEHWFKN